MPVARTGVAARASVRAHGLLDGETEGGEGKLPRARSGRSANGPRSCAHPRARLRTYFTGRRSAAGTRGRQPPWLGLLSGPAPRRAVPRHIQSIDSGLADRIGVKIVFAARSSKCGEQLAFGFSSYAAREGCSRDGINVFGVTCRAAHSGSPELQFADSSQPTRGSWQARHARRNQTFAG